jgi:serine/threonine-protein kinase
VVDTRYRIIGLLGKGGMGEVYRADDLRLGQQVAIKLLPQALATDPQRLMQFHNEVRTARQVSHPNVCRVYDIGDLAVTGGAHQLFLTMENVDGEDLSSLLRRIGRLPEDKALEIARQVCAGLGAAHSRGVVHRDLKPANIMLDSTGQVRLMDFGLAAVGAVSDIRAGTPAYMAPEQLSGTEVTALSDIFALGLVLYELFTGRRAFQVKTLGELVELHQTGAIVPPTALVPGLDPAIERAIMRCLAADPTQRPQSAMAVSAALPGGDPLAAAMAAGETPSPQMVAAAGDDSSVLSLPMGAAWLVASLLLLVLVALLANRLTLNAQIPFERSPSTLFDRAKDLETSFGFPTPTDRASGLWIRSEFLAWLRTGHEAAQAASTLRSGVPPAMIFWYRSSPELIVPVGNVVTPSDPPFSSTGANTIALDLDGHLLSFEHMTPQLQSATTSASPVMDWAPFFAAANIATNTLTPTTPTYSPRVFADTRLAWTGTWPGRPDVELRVEAGSTLGRPVYFRTFGPWNGRESGVTPTSGVAAISLLALLVGPALMIAAALFARANVRAGRGDRIGARKLATVAVLAQVVGWVFAAQHIADVNIEQQRLFGTFGKALFGAAMLWLFYLAAEPYVRRTWPHILITWSRLLGGRYRDRMVGRDLLIGAACGVAMTVISYGFHLAPEWLAWPMFEAHTPDMLLGTRALLARVCFQISGAMENAMLGVFGLALLRAFLQKIWAPLGNTWAAFIVATMLFAPLAARGQFQSGLLAFDLTFGVILVFIILGVIFRFGLFAGIVGFFCHFWTWGVAITLDPARPYFETSIVALALVAAIAITGFTLARSAHSTT